MRSVIWLVLLFVVAVVAALTLGDNEGLASFYWAGWRLDFSLNFFVLAAIGTGFAVVTAVQASERARRRRRERRPGLAVRGLL